MPPIAHHRGKKRSEMTSRIAERAAICTCRFSSLELALCRLVASVCVDVYDGLEVLHLGKDLQQGRQRLHVRLKRLRNWMRLGI
jgi:hypothetical protein